MNEHELKQLFAEAEQIKPSESAKERTLHAAMSEFRSAQSTSEAEKKTTSGLQGIARWFRLKGEPKTQERKTIMTTQAEPLNPFARSHRIWQFAGASTLSVLCVALVVNYYPASERTGDSDLLVRSEPAAKSDQGVATATLESELSMPMTERAEELASATDSFSALPPQTLQNLQPKLARQERSLGSAAALPALSDAQAPGGASVEGRDRFESFEESGVKLVSDQPISTFSIDVDTASYAFVRRQLNAGVLPQKDAVRAEEMINYFDYAYPAPQSDELPFATHISVIDAPWNDGNKLIHLGIQGHELVSAEQPRTNLVLLLDVSGSMNSPDKLPLVKQSMELLLSQLHPEDTVAIAVYAGAAGVVLEPTEARDKSSILGALDRLQAGGSTAGGKGLKLAYQLAERGYREGAVNRVILATDGDFNVGIRDQTELKGFVERKREEGIFLSVLGFGQGNYQDALMQTLAQNGNGVAAYIDTLGEAQKVLVTEANSALFPIAKDVKLQVEFNPRTVSEYRLIGYETRALNTEDFNNDRVDAGDIGAGHSVTAIYEITPVGSDSGWVSERRYSTSEETQSEDATDQEYGYLSLRYKLPDEDRSRLISQPIQIESDRAQHANLKLKSEARFATAVAGFAQLLRGGRYTGDWSFDDAIELAQATKGEDLFGYRTEFIQLIRKAKIASDL